MPEGIVTIAEQREGQLKKVSLELLNIGKELADKTGTTLSAVVVGKGIAGLAETLGKHGAQKVYVVEHDALDNYNTEGYTTALHAAVQQADPAVLLAGATAMGRDLLPRLAARLKTAVFTDCTKLDINSDGLLECTRPVYSGKAYRVGVIPDARPQTASVRPNTYAPAEESGGNAEIVNVDAGIDAGSIRAKVTETVKAAGAKADLTEASIIMSGGRAMGNSENFSIIHECADVIGATVGASRAAVDSGYAPHSMQVGQTGKVVNPNLYIACGISGAIQHLAGMRTSKVIVAINKDPEAPIFQKADYGIVNDLFKVVPELTKAFTALMAEG